MPGLDLLIAVLRVPLCKYLILKLLHENDSPKQYKTAFRRLHDVHDVVKWTTPNGGIRFVELINITQLVC